MLHQACTRSHYDQFNNLHEHTRQASGVGGMTGLDIG